LTGNGIFQSIHGRHSVHWYGGCCVYRQKAARWDCRKGDSRGECNISDTIWWLVGWGWKITPSTAAVASKQARTVGLPCATYRDSGRRREKKKTCYQQLPLYTLTSRWSRRTEDEKGGVSALGETCVQPTSWSWLRQQQLAPFAIPKIGALKKK
jgi:hypothetical protein